MTYSQAKQCIQDLGRSDTESLITSLDDDIVEAGLSCDILPENIEEAYQGEYDSNADFAQQIVDDCYDLSNVPSFVDIDWDSTSKDLMMDYVEENGHYFRLM